MPTAREGLEDRFRVELYRVRRFFRKQGASPADAEDWAHEVLERAWRNDAFARAPSALRYFLTQASHGKLRQVRHAPQETPAGLLRVGRPRPDPFTAFVTKLTRGLVHASLRRLKRAHRAAILLHDIEGLRASEAARVLEVPLFTFYSRLRSGRLRLASRLRQVDTIRQPGVFAPVPGGDPVRPAGPRRLS